MNLTVLRARVALNVDFNDEEREFLLYAIRMSAVTLLCQAHEKEKAMTVRPWLSASEAK